MDLRVIKILNAAPVRNISAIEGMSPPVMDITGSGFLYADSVVVNGLPSQSFSVISDNRIIAEIPDIGTSQVSTVEVWLSLLNRTGRNKILPGLGVSTKTSTGIELLIQRFIKCLLTTPGTDAWGGAGGGLKGLLASPTDKAGNSITTAATLAISVARDYLASLDVPDEEKLLQLDILEMRWNPDELGLYIDVVLTNVAGQTTQTTLGFGDG
jgi:hypothetical protein